MRDQRALNERIVQHKPIEQSDGPRAILAPLDPRILISVRHDRVDGAKSGVLDKVHFLHGLDHGKAAERLVEQGLSFDCCG